MRFARAAVWGLTGLVVLCTGPTLAGDVAIVRYVLSDNGDDDGYADTNETVELRITVVNQRDTPLTGLTALVETDNPEIECLIQHAVWVGDLAVGETRHVDTPFAFKVADVNRMDPYEDLAARFRISMRSNESAALEVASREIVLELDLDATGGAGPGSYFEGFESGEFGSLTTMNLDAGRSSEAASEGFRCQYNDPDWLWGNAYQPVSDCWLGASEAHADAFFWQISDGDPAAPLPGRSYTGRYSAYMGVPLPDSDDWTTPMATLEALASGAPVNLGVGHVCSTTRTVACASDPDCPPGEACVAVASELSFKQQVDFPDWRVVTNAREGRTVHGAAIGVQVADEAGNPVGDWVKIHPYRSAYDQQREDNYTYNCYFDPTDDGNDEDDYFDPTDPERRLGPSTLCYPELVWSYMGDTDEPFDPANVGNGDGPGLAGETGLGTWVESRFNLQQFQGRRIRLRFLSGAIKSEAYETYEDLFLWNPVMGDDGWWIDDIKIDDALVTPATLIADAKDNSGLPGVTDGDGDRYCDSDCDDGEPACNVDCSDADSDGSRMCSGDCDDANPAVRPGAEEVCDGLSNDCDHPSWPLVDYWRPASVDEPGSRPWSVHVADVDGDGDLDALSAWSDSDTVAWHENTAGDGSAWTTRPISTTALDAAAVHGADLDGDGDTDVVAASYSDAEINWHENTVGDGSSWTEIPITTVAFNPRGVLAVDLDGDDDLDVLAAVSDTSQVFWYENVAGDGSLWADRPLVPPNSRARALDAADFDGDGQMDVAIAGRYDTEWYERSGATWHSRMIEEQSGDDSLSAGDLDGDGDADLLAGRSDEDSVAWYENVSGNGSVWTRHLLSESAVDVQAVLVADVDGDGDLDGLSAAPGNGEIVWYENASGDGSSWVLRPISWNAAGATSISSGDLDGDGELDLLSTGWEGITWYERANLELDDDGDGLADCEGDCDDTDLHVWSVPGEVRDLTFLEDRQTLSWSAPAEPGGTTPFYDTLRAEAGDGFLAGGCVESGDGSDTQAVDTDPIASGAIYYYLVVAGNSCGRGTAGTGSDELQRQVCACP